MRHDDMAAWPRISVITPSYNQGGFIEETIRSVLDQDYPDLEYIVVDGASTDATLSVLRKYQDRLRWISEPDRGQSEAINKGFRMATGEILAFLNSDDLYEPGALSAVGSYFADHPEAMWLTGRCRIIDHEGGEIRPAVTAYKNMWLRLHSYRVLQILNYISQMATFWRRPVLETIGGVDESLHYAMDYDYWLRIGRVYRLTVLNRCLARFRIHPSSKAGASASAQFDADYEIARKHVRSPVVLGLHRLHSAAIVSTYRPLLTREHARAGPAPKLKT